MRQIACCLRLPVANRQIGVLLVVLIDTDRVLEARGLVGVIDVDVLLLLAQHGLLSPIHMSRCRDSAKQRIKIMMESDEKGKKATYMLALFLPPACFIISGNR